jgi:hypothetical protein
MSLREDLIANAVEFLQDSRVAASSEEKKRKCDSISASFLFVLNLEFFAAKRIDSNGN